MREDVQKLVTRVESSGANQGERSQRLPAGVRLEPMRETDLKEVHALETRLFPLDAWPLRAFEEELAASETRVYLVAALGEGAGREIIGYAGLMYIPPIADVQTIAVVPEHEGHGVGSALLAHLVELSESRGAEALMLEVRADNERAQNLYRRFGFERIHRRPHYYRDGEHALIMRKSLENVGLEDPQ